MASREEKIAELNREIAILRAKKDALESTSFEDVARMVEECIDFSSYRVGIDSCYITGDENAELRINLDNGIDVIASFRYVE